MALLIYDPTISTGNLLTVVTIICATAVALIKRSYEAGRYAQEFIQIHVDLKEIKATLKEQDASFRSKANADALADGLQLVTQQRVATLEHEVGRCRENIHRIANQVQLDISRREREGA